MKHKISISVEKDTYFKVLDLLKNSKKFRNRSHVFEYAVEKLAKEAAEKEK
ncbi:hypothetical protein GF327_07910 [Candidatus Woesearchaeota archaeon]|nr:hypothetical protein [Candidatus Woesearchaeota archaeon]